MIYDCMIFNDEIRMLELHLNVLDYIVDRFVIAESIYTFSGRRKPYYFFEENFYRFDKFVNKITFIPVDEPPSSNRWENEYALREHLSAGLRNAKDEDYIVIGDVDEIADPHLLKGAVQRKVMPFVFDTHTYYYYLNVAFIEPEPSTSRCIVVTPKKVLGSIQNARNSRLSLQPIKGGWHFSYVGGITRIINKLGDFSHWEYDTEFYKDPMRIHDKLENKEDLFDRKNVKLGVIPLSPHTHPEYLLMNIDKYKDWITT